MLVYNLLRKPVLLLLKLFNRDINIKHHYTGETFTLNLYRHKGYWFKGKNREKESMIAFKKLIRNADSIIEVGGHIGYLSTYFASLVNNGGQVIVFEPGQDNLKYLIKNCNSYKSIKVENKGIGDKNRIMPLYVESLTGQNNTFSKDFKGFEINKAASIEKDLKYKVENIEVVTLDSYIHEFNISPQFVKIDVEGFELPVVLGCKNLIKKEQTIFMIEVQENVDEIFNIFFERYNIFFETGDFVENFEQFESLTFGMNRFFIPKSRMVNNSHKFGLSFEG